MYKKGGALKSFNMIEGGYLKNMGAISGGLEKIWNKKQFLLHSPLQLKLWLVPNSNHLRLVGRICADLGPDCSHFVKSTKCSGMTELIMTINMYYGAIANFSC